MSANFTKWRIEIKVGEHIVESMVAIDKNKIKTRISPREICSGPVGTIFNETESGPRPCSISVCVRESYSMPELVLKRIDCCVATGLVPRKCREKIESAVAVSHSDFQCGFGFRRKTKIVEPNSLWEGNFCEFVHFVKLAIRTSLWFPAVH